MPNCGDPILHGYRVHFFRLSTNSCDFPSTAEAIARQCGIIRNEKVDDINDLSIELSSPIKEYNPEDPLRICKSIVLSGKDLNEMKDSQWDQVPFCAFNG